MSYRDTVRHQQMTGRVARAMVARAMPEPRVDLPSPGARVRLLHISDMHTSLRSGAEGTVSLVDAMGTVHVNWDSGSGLGLIPGEDLWVVLE